MAFLYPWGNTQQLNLDWILQKIKELESGGGGGADIEEIANVLVALTYRNANTYQRYDYAFYNGKLYRAIANTTGAFNPADWLEVQLGNDVAILTRLVNALDTSLTTLQGQVADLDSDDVDNASNVTGDTVSDALDNLNSAITSLDTQTNSVEWTPASGDTLLAFILANCTRTKLPFSFVKKGSNTVSDVPTDINAKEFTGFVYGTGDRITVQIEHYANNISAFFQRTIYQNNWYAGSWLTFTKSEQPKAITVTAGQYTVGGSQYSRWINGIAEVQGTLNMSGYQINSTIISMPDTYFQGYMMGLIFTDGGGKTWFPRVRTNGSNVEIYTSSTLTDGWYNFFLLAFNQTY